MTKRGRIHYRYPRRHFRRRRSGGMTIPIAPIAGMIAGIAEPVQTAMTGNYMLAMSQIARNYTGFDDIGFGTPIFRPENLMRGVVPLVAGLMIHKFVGGRPLNANAALARAKVPLIRI